MEIEKNKFKEMDSGECDSIKNSQSDNRKQEDQDDPKNYDKIAIEKDGVSSEDYHLNKPLTEEVELKDILQGNFEPGNDTGSYDNDGSKDFSNTNEDANSLSPLVEPEEIHPGMPLVSPKEDEPLSPLTEPNVDNDKKKEGGEK